MVGAAGPGDRGDDKDNGAAKYIEGAKDNGAVNYEVADRLKWMKQIVLTIYEVS